MKKKTENPAAMVSKEWIIESLFDMLAIKPLSSITISEISENANVDRRTFYRHFKTKNDVIKYYIYTVLKQYEKYQYQLTKPEILKIENIDYILTYERGGIINFIKK